MRASRQTGTGTTRRKPLPGAAALGGAGIAAPSLLPVPRAAAVGAGGELAFPGVDVAIDVSHANTDGAVLVRDYLARKSEADPDGAMTFFSRDPLTYVDAVLGWSWYSWDSLKAALFQFLALCRVSAVDR
jgi:hypothetical protein